VDHEWYDYIKDIDMSLYALRVQTGVPPMTLSHSRPLTQIFT